MAPSSEPATWRERRSILIGEIPKEISNNQAAFVEEEKLGYLFRGKNKGGYFLGL
jgi:hypothetical protein